MSRWQTERAALEAEMEAELSREENQLQQSRQQSQKKQRRRIMTEEQSSSSSEEEQEERKFREPPSPESVSRTSDRTSLVIKEHLAPQPKPNRRIQSTNKIPSPTAHQSSSRKQQPPFADFNPHQHSVLSPKHHDRLPPHSPTPAAAARAHRQDGSRSPSLSFIDRELEQVDRLGPRGVRHVTVQPSTTPRGGLAAYARPPDSPSLSDLLRPDRHDEMGDPLGRHHFQGIATVNVPVKSEAQLRRIERQLQHHQQMPMSPRERRRLLEQEATDHGLLSNPLGDDLEFLNQDTLESAFGRQSINGRPPPGVQAVIDQDAQDALLNDRDLYENLPKNHERFGPSEAHINRLQQEAVQAQRTRLGPDGASVIPATHTSLASTAPATSFQPRPKQRIPELDELDAFATTLVTPKGPHAFDPNSLSHLQPPPSPPSPGPNRLDLRLEPPLTPTEIAEAAANGGIAHKNKNVQAVHHEKPARDLFDLTPRVDASTLMRMGAAQVPKLNLSGLLGGTGTTSQAAKVGEEEVKPVSMLSKPTASDLLVEAKTVHTTGDGRQLPIIDFGRATMAAFNVSHGRECVLCHERISEIWCEECAMNLCHECEKVIHQHLEFHTRVSLKDLPELQAKKKSNLQTMKARAQERKMEAHPKKGFQEDLRLIEPPDPLQLPPRSPPSPAHLFALDDYVQAGQELDKNAEIDFFTLAGVCAVCQVQPAKLWCEECFIPLCTREHSTILNRKSCDEELHETVLQWHRRVPFNPEIHKRKHRRGNLDILILPTEEVKRGHHGGEGIWANATPPPSLPPSELPSPTVNKRIQQKKLSLTEQGFNYETGDLNNLPMCEICNEHKSVLFCHDCRFFLCIIGGCDADLHPKPDSEMIIPHDRRYLKDGGKVLITPAEAPKINVSSSFVAPQPKRIKPVEEQKHSHHHHHHHSSSTHSHRSSSYKSPRHLPSAGESTFDSSRYHKHHYSQSPYCEICRRFRATQMCLECELNFCEGGSAEELATASTAAGAKPPQNCAKTWHEQDAAFKKHKLKRLDPELVDMKHVRQPTPNKELQSARTTTPRQLSARGSLTTGTGSVSARIASARSTARSAMTSESEEDEIRRTKRELAELRQQREEEEELLELERQKLEREEERLRQELGLKQDQLALQNELDAAADAKEEEESEESLDDIQLLRREQRRKAQLANEGELSFRRKPSVVVLPYDHPDFDPLSIEPPQCSVCEKNQADVFCKECKEFFCSHPLNEWDLKTPRKQGGPKGGIPSPPHTARPHNNCDFHKHNLASNRDHERISLPHYATAKVERRAARVKEREEELAAAQLKEQQARDRELAEKRRIEEERQERLAEKERAKQERQAQRDARKQAKENAYKLAELQAQEEAERRGNMLRQQDESIHLAFLKDQRKRIQEMERRRAAMLQELRDEEEREYRKHLLALEKRDEELREEELERWRILREEARRKRLVREKNLKQLREWNARRKIEEERWSHQVTEELQAQTKAELERRDALKKAEEARLTKLIERSRIITHKTPIDFSVPEGVEDDKSQFQINLKKQQLANRRDLLEAEIEKRQEELERRSEALLEGQVKAREIVREQREKEEDEKIFQERKEQRLFLARQEELKLQRQIQRAKEKARKEKEELTKLKQAQALEELKARQILERTKKLVAREEMLERERLGRLEHRRRLRREASSAGSSVTNSSRTSTSSKGTGSSASSVSGSSRTNSSRTTHSHTTNGSNSSKVIPSLRSLLGGVMIDKPKQKGKSPVRPPPLRTSDSPDRSGSRSRSRSSSRSRSRSRSRSGSRSSSSSRSRSPPVRPSDQKKHQRKPIQPSTTSSLNSSIDSFTHPEQNAMYKNRLIASSKREAEEASIDSFDSLDRPKKSKKSRNKKKKKSSKKSKYLSSSSSSDSEEESKRASSSSKRSRRHRPSDLIIDDRPRSRSRSNSPLRSKEKHRSRRR